MTCVILVRGGLLLLTMSVLIRGHGRLVDPPSRASAWRFGFSNLPKDYNDNEGFCGGFSHQYQTQGGRCGICGDAWEKNPRPHEAGGKYATGTIVRRYTEGQVVAIKVQLTANHRGHFEFRICPNNNPKVEATQTCLNQHPLYPVDGSGFQYKVGTHNGEYTVNIQLPRGLTCTQCVLQWRYVAANNWGYCEDGTGAVGCGPQEEFRACSDVAISKSSTGFTQGTNQTEGGTETVTSSYSWYSTPPTSSPFETPPPLTPSTQRPKTTTQKPKTTRTTTQKPRTTTRGRGGGCRAVGAWKAIPNMDQWCESNCKHVPSYCPPSHCTCD